MIRSPYILSAGHKRLTGFTLMELMFVVGIISIIGIIVGPGLKKAYSDFKVKETYNKLNTIMLGMRDFYLVHNEPLSVDYGASYYVDARITTFLPLGWVNVNHIHHWGPAVDGSLSKDYHPLNFQKLYLITSDWIQSGEFMLHLYTISKPYYWDDLLATFRQKGCTISESSGHYYIYLPEKHSDNWFL